MHRRLLAAVAATMAAVIVAAIGGAGWLVSKAARGRLYSEVAQIPARKVGLVLGTSDKRRNGKPNPFFTYRIEAAAELYRAGKVRHLLVSGDNHRRGYDEPALMKAALLEMGVPERAITVDCAGFRTLDSMVRAKAVFGLDDFTVISQRFHNERALFIGKHYDIDAIGFCARDVGVRRGLKTQIREGFARIKAVLDLYILQTRPKFLGARQKIPLA